MNYKYYKQQPEKMILRDYMAYDRTLLAYDRTFLAYARTVISFIVAAISLYKALGGVSGIIVVSILVPSALYFAYKAYHVRTELKQQMDYIEHHLLKEGNQALEE